MSSFQRKTCNCFAQLLSGGAEELQSGQIEKNFRIISRYTHPDKSDFIDKEESLTIQTLIAQAKDNLLGDAHERVHDCRKIIRSIPAVRALIYLHGNKSKEADTLLIKLKDRVRELEDKLESVKEEADKVTKLEKERQLEIEEFERVERDLELKIAEANRQLEELPDLDVPNQGIGRRGRPRKVDSSDPGVAPIAQKVRISTVNIDDKKYSIEQVVGIHINRNGIKLKVKLPKTGVSVDIEDFNFFKLEGSKTKLKEYFENLEKRERDNLFRSKKMMKLYLQTLQDQPSIEEVNPIGELVQ